MIEKSILQRHLTESEGKKIFEFYQVKFIDYDLGPIKLPEYDSGYISFNVLIHLFGQRTLAKALSANSIYNEICYNGQIYGNICLYDRCLEIHNRIFETPIILPPEKDLPQFDIETDKIKSPRKRKNSNNSCAGAT